MCDVSTLVPIPDLLWGAGAIYQFDPAHAEYGVDDEGRRCLALDTCIVPAVEALWAAGIVTMSCCCGHGDPWGVITIQTRTSQGRRGAMVVRVEDYDSLTAQLATERAAREAAETREQRLRRAGDQMAGMNLYYLENMDSSDAHPDDLAAAVRDWDAARSAVGAMPVTRPSGRGDLEADSGGRISPAAASR